MLGERIKLARMEKGMTAKELAERSEVTPGYISQIERDLISPSLSVLMRIVEALEVPIVSLFSEEAKEEVTVTTKESRTTIKFPDNNMEYQFMTPYSRNKDICTQMEVLFFRLEPKTWGSAKVQIHEEAGECVYLLSGHLQYHIHDKIYDLKAGDCIYIPPCTPHQMFNPGETETTGIGIISPAVY